MPSINDFLRLSLPVRSKNIRNTTLCQTLGLLLICLAIWLASGAAHAELRVRVMDVTGNQQIIPYSAGGSVSINNGEYNFQVLSDQAVARMRVTVQNSECPIGRLQDIANADDPRTDTDDNPSRRFPRGQFTLVASNALCVFRFDAWYENYRWAGQVNLTVEFGPVSEDPESDPQTNPETTLFAITQGTPRSTAMDTSSPVVPVPNHGTRIYCPVSHFSYDDPVVHPGRPNAAHMHMFWGNTAADANTTLESLFSNGLSSCEGGLNNRSAYWMPALFNEQDEVVLPEGVVAYYKSFGSTPGFDRNAIMPIPNGLQMLANRAVNNGGPWNFIVEPENRGGQSQIRIKLSFPTCLEVDARNTPVLASADNTSHLSYADTSGATSGDCPASHPYRIPQLQYNVRYDVPYDSGWYLSSDSDANTQGQSLHADYIAAWDDTSMNRLVQCNRESRRECQFLAYEDGQRIGRSQLPERFLSPDGATVYESSFQLDDSADRTPFGRTLGKMR